MESRSTSNSSSAFSGIMTAAPVYPLERLWRGA
jgi:hypothetical protein